MVYIGQGCSLSYTYHSVPYLNIQLPCHLHCLQTCHGKKYQHGLEHAVECE